MDERRPVKQSNGQKMRLLVVIVAVFILLITTLILAFSQGFFARSFGKLDLNVSIPPSLNEQTLWGPKLNHERLLLQMELKLLNNSEEDAASEEAGFMNERWLDLASALFYTADEVQLHAETHALLLLYAAETGDKALFESLLSTIDHYFLMGDGLLRQSYTEAAANPADYLQDDTRPEASALVEESLAADSTVWKSTDQADVPDLYASLVYMRSLALAYQNWGERSYGDALAQAADSYLALCLNDLPPLHPQSLKITPTPPTFVNEEGAVTATPTPSPVPDDSDTVKKMNLIRFSDIDLYALSILRQIDPAFDVIYENALNIMTNAQRDNLFVYSEAYDPVSESYVQYFSEAVVHLDEQLKIMMGLAEVSSLPAGSSAWLRSRLNNYELVETYSLYDVSSTGATSLPLRYGQICRLARLLDDTQLYQAAFDRLLEANISTVSQSPIYGLVFRSAIDGNETQITAIDNAWALLGTK